MPSKGLAQCEIEWPWQVFGLRADFVLLDYADHHSRALPVLPLKAIKGIGRVNGDAAKPCGKGQDAPRPSDRALPVEYTAGPGGIPPLFRGQ